MLKYHIKTAGVVTEGMTEAQRKYLRSLPDSTIFIENSKWGPAKFQPKCDNRVLYNTESYKLSDEEIALTVQLQSYIKAHPNCNFLRNANTHDTLKAPVKMLAGLFNVEGTWRYLTFDDPLYQKYCLGLNRLLKEFDIDQKARGRLLVDWSKITPYTNELVSDPNSRISEKFRWSAAERALFQRVAWGRFWRNYVRFDVSKFNFSLKKATSPGADLILPSGIPAKREEMQWSLPIPALAMVVRSNYSFFKQKLFTEKGPFSVQSLLSGQLGLVSAGGITVDNLWSALDHHLVNHSKYLRRFTSLDPSVVDLPITWEENYTKDRGFTIINKVGYAYTGTFNQKELCRYWGENDPKKKGAACRVRFANSMDQNKLYGYQVLFHGFLSELESGARGFPSLNSKVMDRINDFCMTHPASEWVTKIFEGDRTASDKTITSNPWLLLDLYDSDLLPWRRDVYGKTILSSHAGGRIAPFCQASGHPGTTFDTHLPGMMEATRDLSYWLRDQFGYNVLDSEATILHAFYDEESDGIAKFKDVEVLPTLVSDDIKWWVSIRKEQATRVKWDFDESFCKNVFMSLEFVDHSYSFGMHGSASGIEVNSVLAVQRLHNGEGLGLSAKDGSSTFERFLTLPREIATAVDDWYHTVFGTSLRDYEHFEKEYDLILAMLGLTRLDLTNQYSPVQMALYQQYMNTRLARGLYVPEDPKMSTTVPDICKKEVRDILDVQLASSSKMYRLTKKGV